MKPKDDLERPDIARRDTRNPRPLQIGGGVPSALGLLYAFGHSLTHQHGANPPRQGRSYRNVLRLPHDYGVPFGGDHDIQLRPVEYFE